MIKLQCKTCRGTKKVKSLGSMQKDCPGCDGNGFTIKEQEPIEYKRVIARKQKHDDETANQAEA